MWYVICVVFGILVGIGIARALDPKFDKLQSKLEEIHGAIKK